MRRKKRGMDASLIAINFICCPFWVQYYYEACFFFTGKGKSSAELVCPLEEPLKRNGGTSVVVEQKLESSEVISETPSKKRSRTKQKSINSTTLEENSVSNVKINKTSVQKKTLVGMLIFFT